MGYLAEFKYDVFLSYAHIDNVKPDNESQGRITKFYKQFKLELDRYLEADNTAEVWCDHELSGNTAFDHKIKNVLDGSALFLAFTSGAYSRSKYCNLELNHFFTTANSSKLGIAVKDNRRIFNIQLLNKSFKEWDEPFKGGGKYPLFKPADPDSNNRDEDPGITLDSDSPEDKEEYKRVMVKIVRDVCRILKEIKDASDANDKQVAAKTNGQQRKIFIGKTSDTLISVKEKIINGLAANNLVVDANPVPPPWNKTEHEQAVSSKMDDAVLTIHLFDEIAGDRIAADYPYSFSQEQLLIGKRLNKEQLIFIPQELNIDSINDKTHSTFLTELMTKKESNDKYNLIRELSDQQIVQHILDRVNKPVHESGFEGGVLLDFHEKDLSTTVEYYNQLQNNNTKIFLTTPGSNPLDIINQYDKALQEVTTVIIVCFTVATNWLFERIKQIICAIQTGKSHIKKLMVYKQTGTEEINLEEMKKLFA